MLDAVTTTPSPILPAFTPEHFQAAQAWKLLNVNVEHVPDLMEDPESADILLFFTNQPRRVLLAEARNNADGTFRVDLYEHDGHFLGAREYGVATCQEFEEIRQVLIDFLSEPVED